MTLRWLAKAKASLPHSAANLDCFHQPSNAPTQPNPCAIKIPKTFPQHETTCQMFLTLRSIMA